MNSRLLYLDGLGVWVGEFTDADLDAGRDKEMIEKLKGITGFSAINKRVTTDSNGDRLTRLWVCKPEDVSKDKGKTGVRKDYEHE